MEEEVGTESAPGRVGRIAEQTRGLFEDMKTWVDLKLQLVEMQVTERIESAINQVAVGAVLAILLFLTVLMALVTGGLALGEWFGRPSLGFLAVTGLLAVITLIVYLAKPRFVRMAGDEPPAKPDAAIPAAAEPRKLPSPTSTKDGEGGTDEAGV